MLVSHLKISITNYVNINNMVLNEKNNILQNKKTNSLRRAACSTYLQISLMYGLIEENQLLISASASSIA